MGQVYDMRGFASAAWLTHHVALRPLAPLAVSHKTLVDQRFNCTAPSTDVLVGLMTTFKHVCLAMIQVVRLYL